MTLNEAQVKAVESGEPQRFIDPATKTELVIVRADIYEKLRHAVEESDPSLYEFDEIRLFDK